MICIAGHGVRLWELFQIRMQDNYYRLIPTADHTHSYTRDSGSTRRWTRGEPALVSGTPFQLLFYAKDQVRQSLPTDDGMEIWSDIRARKSQTL